MPAVHALTERRHGLISTPRLGLTVADHALFALATLELLGDALFDLGYHGIVHVFLLKLLVGGTTLVRLHLVVAHGNEALGRDFAGGDALAEGLVGLILEILEE